MFVRFSTFVAGLALLALITGFSAQADAGPAYVQLGFCNVKAPEGESDDNTFPTALEYYVNAEDAEKLSSGPTDGTEELRGMVSYQQHLDWDGPKNMKFLVEAKIVVKTSDDGSTLVAVRFNDMSLGVDGTSGVVFRDDQKVNVYTCNEEAKKSSRPAAAAEAPSEVVTE